MLNSRALLAAAALQLLLASMTPAQAMSPVCRKATGHLIGLIQSASAPQAISAIDHDLIHSLLRNSPHVSLAKPDLKLPVYSAAAFIDAAKRWPLGFTPSKDLLDAFEASNGNLEVTRIPGDMVFAGNSIGGTASCNSTTFFKVEDGTSHVVDGPAAWENDVGGSCGLTRAIASIGGTSFVVEDDSNLGPGLVSNLTLTPWVAGNWLEPCHLQVSFAPVFDTRKTVNDWSNLNHWEKNTCERDVCKALRRAALNLARRTQSGPGKVERRLLRTMTASQRAEYRRLRRLAEKPDARPSQIKPADLRDDLPLLLPMVVNRQVYLASVGHFTIGWRVFSDWKVAIAIKDADKALEIARFAIGMAKGRIVAATSK